MPKPFVFENDPNNRFQVSSGPNLPPGKCVVCGAHDRPVLDFGANLEVDGYYWILYICIECMKSASHVVDRYTGADVEREQAASASLESLLSAKKLRAITDEQYSDIIAFRDSLAGLGDSSVADLPDEEDDAEELSSAFSLSGNDDGGIGFLSESFSRQLKGDD